MGKHYSRVPDSPMNEPQGAQIGIQAVANEYSVGRKHVQKGRLDVVQPRLDAHHILFD